MTAPVKSRREAPAESRLGLLRRAMSLTILDAIGKTMAFLAVIVIARQCGPEVLGKLSYAQAVAAYALTAANCGLELYAVRAVATASVPLPRLVPTIVTLRLLTATTSFTVLILVTLSVPAFRSQFLVVSLYGLSAFSLAFSLSWVSQAVRKTHVMGLALAGAQVIYLLIVLIVASPKTASWSVPLALVAGEFVVAAFVFRWVRREVGALGPPLPLREALSLLRGAVPIGVAQILRAFALGSDLVVVGLLLSFLAAGYYSSAFKLYAFGISSIALYMTTLFPRIAHVAHSEGSRLTKELVASIGIMMAVGGPLLALAAWFADDLLAGLYGNDFREAASALRVMLATLVVYGVTAHFRSALIGLHRQRFDMLGAGLVGVVHIGAKLVLGTRYGMTGVAVGGLIGEAVYMAICAAGYQRYATTRRQRGTAA
jgi:O-antigen/teichoic acid export membrane protein